jgi:hypothetical protein
MRAGRAPLSRVDVRTARALLLALVLGSGLVLTAIAATTAPRPAALGLGVVLVSAAVWFVKPLLGLHLMVLFALIGDISTMPWYPYTKNFSARESSLYLTNVVAFSPLELTVGVAFLALVVRYLAMGTWPLRAGRAIAPVAAFTGFVMFGLVRGIGSGGDLRIALFEARAMLVLGPVYVLMVSVCRRPAHYRGLLVTALVGIWLNSVLSLVHVLATPSSQRLTPEALIEHGSALRMNLIILALIAAMLFRGIGASTRIVLAIGSIPVFWIYFLSQRRAAFIALGVASVPLFATLAWRQRRTFRIVVPIVVLVMVGFVGAFWNSTSSVSFPAQAVKSVIAPGEVSDRNESSDLYRTIETADLNFTIRQTKLLGLGFGHAFYRPFPLADLGTFEFYLYIPHNSILAIWIKLGFGGLVALFCVFGTAIMRGARRLRTVVRIDDLMTILLALSFVIMLAVFAFVDIAWDARNMLLLAVSVAICCDSARQGPARTSHSSTPAEPEAARQPVGRP